MSASLRPRVILVVLKIHYQDLTFHPAGPFLVPLLIVRWSDLWPKVLSRWQRRPPLVTLLIHTTEMMHGVISMSGMKP